MKVIAMVPDDIIRFTRTKELRFLRELGAGACGETVLLRDDDVGLDVVCKKYSPSDSSDRVALFENFRREIQLLYNVYHVNVCRIFTHYLYPAQHVGYILMEHVPGHSIEDHLKLKSESIESAFLQSIEGFAHLQAKGILHRDIRAGNLLVSSNGTVKIIDLGFGKAIPISTDVKKSITLNWAYDRPLDFEDEIYDFQTEVYFVGQLFLSLIARFGIEGFKYSSILGQMARSARQQRLPSFRTVLDECRRIEFVKPRFTDHQKLQFRAFADELLELVSGFSQNDVITDDPNAILQQFKEIYESSMLDEFVPEPQRLIRVLCSGEFRYGRYATVAVANLLAFIQLLEASDEGDRRLIIANLRARLRGVPRFVPPPADDIPF